jgi:hypothetical protein
MTPSFVAQGDKRDLHWPFEEEKIDDPMQETGIEYVFTDLEIDINNILNTS